MLPSYRPFSPIGSILFYPGDRFRQRYFEPGAGVRSANSAAEKLQSQVSSKAMALRDGQPHPIPTEEVVPGDVVLLSAGSLILADGIVLETKDYFVNQAVLTGETFPVEKIPGTVAAAASISERSNTVFMGTNVRSGSARVLICQTGAQTSFGQIAGRLNLRPPETEFEHGIKTWVTCYRGHVCPGDRNFRAECVFPKAGDRFTALFHRFGRRADTTAAASHY